MKTKKATTPTQPVASTEKKDLPKKGLFGSNAEAEAEIAGLRRGQEQRDAAPLAGENDARTSLI